MQEDLKTPSLRYNKSNESFFKKIFWVSSALKLNGKPFYTYETVKLMFETMKNAKIASSIIKIFVNPKRSETQAGW